MVRPGEDVGAKYSIETYFSEEHISERREVRKMFFLVFIDRLEYVIKTDKATIFHDSKVLYIYEYYANI